MRLLRTLLIRADADSQIGTGHVMRCLALAQAWRETGGAVTFLCRPLPPPLASRLAAEGIRVAALPPDTQAGQDDAAALVRLAKVSGADWIVVDGYQFNSAYQNAVHHAGLKLLVLDDNGDTDFYWADLVLNQNIHAEAGWYENRAPHTRLLLGTQYALLRSEFLFWAQTGRTEPQTARKVLVTLGGSDPDNVTREVLQALSLAAVPGLEVTVVIGGGNPHWAGLEAEAAHASVPVTLAVNAQNMPELMAQADLAVSAAGSTVWELAFLGVPSLLLVTAGNQSGIAAGTDAAGAAVSLGPAGTLTAEVLASAVTELAASAARRKEISRRARQLVDGLGAERVISECLHNN